MDVLLLDLRYAIRALRRTPGLALLAVLCMGLGIGAVTSMYSTATAFVFKPLPQLRDPGSLMHVWEGPAAFPDRDDGISAPVFEEVRKLAAFSDVGAVRFWSANITGVDLPEQVRAVRMTPGTLRTLGRRPALGRDFTAQDGTPGADHSVILGHGLWQRRFAGDSGLVGRTVQINGEAYTVAGIMPEDFIFPAGAQLWTPLAVSAEMSADRVHRNLFALARLAPGVSRPRAEAAVAALGARLASAYPAASDGWVMRAEPAVRTFGAGPRPFMVVLLAASAIVLLIACANVANLLLARATGRRRELAVRLALGAQRSRIVRQLLTESVLISLAGAVIGSLLAVWGLAGITASVPVEVREIIPGFGMLHLDAQALAVTLLVAVASGVLFGLAPAFAAARVDIQGSLKEGARGEVGAAHSGRMRNALVVSEVALSLMLLVGAAETLATFRRIALTDPGFRRDGVLTLSVTLPAADYPKDSAVTVFYRNLEDRVAGLPGVVAVGATTILPLSFSEDREGVEVEGKPLRRPDDALRIGIRSVSPSYLQTLGVPVIEGRALTPLDGPDAPFAAVVSRAAVQLLWPGESALGKRFKIRSGQWVEVVGVAANVRGNPLNGGDTRPVMYLPGRQWPARMMSLVVRSSGDPTRLTSLIQREVRALDTRLAAGSVLSMRRVIEVATSPWAATSQTLAAGAIVALVLAFVGLYGVMAYSVAQRTQELGVRVALGASGAGILRLVLGRAAILAGIGIAIGIGGAIALSRGLQAILVDASATDALTIAGVALGLAAVALAAGIFPALRASHVDPMEALRSE
jgi:putative ABC transport system permease protein